MVNGGFTGGQSRPGGRSVIVTPGGVEVGSALIPTRSAGGGRGGGGGRGAGSRGAGRPTPTTPEPTGPTQEELAAQAEVARIANLRAALIRGGQQERTISSRDITTGDQLIIRRIGKGASRIVDVENVTRGTTTTTTFEVPSGGGSRRQSGGIIETRAKPITPAKKPVSIFKKPVTKRVGVRAFDLPKGFGKITLLKGPIVLPPEIREFAGQETIQVTKVEDIKNVIGSKPPTVILKSAFNELSRKTDSFLKKSGFEGTTLFTKDSEGKFVKLRTTVPFFLDIAIRDFEKKNLFVKDRQGNFVNFNNERLQDTFEIFISQQLNKLSNKTLKELSPFLPKTVIQFLGKPTEERTTDIFKFFLLDPLLATGAAAKATKTASKVVVKKAAEKKAKKSIRQLVSIFEDDFVKGNQKGIQDKLKKLFQVISKEPNAAKREIGLENLRKLLKELDSRDIIKSFSTKQSTIKAGAEAGRGQVDIIIDVSEAIRVSGNIAGVSRAIGVTQPIVGVFGAPSKFAGTGQFEKTEETTNRILNEAGSRTSEQIKIINNQIKGTTSNILKNSLTTQKDNLNRQLDITIEKITTQKINTTTSALSQVNSLLNKSQQKLQSLTRQLNLTTNATRQQSLTRQATQQRSITRQLLAQMSLLKTRQRKLQRFRLRTRGKIKKLVKILPPAVLGKVRKGKAFGTGELKNQGYHSFAKQKGINRRLNKVPLSKKQATDLAAFVVDNSTSARGGIVRASGKTKKKPLTRIPNNYFLKTRKKYRTFRIIKGQKVPLQNQFIERKRNRIDTRGEKRGLSVAKIIKQRAKKPKSLGKAFKPDTSNLSKNLKRRSKK